MRPNKSALLFILQLAARLLVFGLVVIGLATLAGKVIHSPIISFTLPESLNYSEGIGKLHLFDMRVRVQAKVSNQLVVCCAIWSPDSTRIAFGSLNEGAVQPYVWDIRNSTTLPLTPPDVNATVVDWSPDSQSILLSVRTENKYVLYRVESDGNRLTRLTFLDDTDFYGDIYDADWSPDGRFIVFAARSGVTWKIYRIEPDGKNLQLLTHSGEQNIAPHISPDGQQIAFISGDQNNRELFIMSADGNSHRQLTRTAGREGTPRWSPDGERILFLTYSPNTLLQIINADGSERHELIDHNISFDNPPSWSPDGMQILYEVQNGKGTQLYVMNDGGSIPWLLNEAPIAVSLNSSWQPQP